MHRKFRVNTPHIVYDNIEGETILINLKNGNYYNIDKYGSLIWEIIEKGVDIEELTEVIVSFFNLPGDQIKEDIDILISDLLMENLIIPLPEEVNSGGIMDIDALNQLIKARLSDFSCPVLKKYSDMRDALMLDPIHEVDDRGWPTMNDDLYFREQSDENEISGLNHMK